MLSVCVHHGVYAHREFWRKLDEVVESVPREGESGD